MTPADRIAAIAARFGIDALYAFGSRATEALACVQGGNAFEAGGPSDLDLSVLPLPGRTLNTDQRVALAAALEDLFPAPRVNLVVLPEAPRSSRSRLCPANCCMSGRGCAKATTSCSSCGAPAIWRPMSVCVAHALSAGL
jgi:hypothetical protein